MMYRSIFVVILICIHLLAMGQASYEVNVDDRNAAIDLNKKAEEFIEADNTEKAIEKLMESIKVDSVLRETYILAYKAWVKYRTCTDTVASILKKGRRIFSDDDVLCFYSAEIMRIQSQIPEAILEYTNATNYAKRNGEDYYLVPYYYFNRANCMLQMQMNDGALADYNYAIVLNPEFAAAYHNRGVCLYKLARKDKACLDWNRALELGYKGSAEYVTKYCK